MSDAQAARPDGSQEEAPAAAAEPRPEGEAASGKSPDAKDLPRATAKDASAVLKDGLDTSLDITQKSLDVTVGITKTAAVATGADKILEKINEFANRNNIMIFLLFDLVVSCCGCVFFVIFKETALLTMWNLVHWYGCAALMASRGVVDIVSLVCVYQRRLQATRVAFGALCAQIICTFIMMMAVRSTACECTSFLQCRALFQFAPSQVSYINPYAVTPYWSDQAHGCDNYGQCNSKVGPINLRHADLPDVEEEEIEADSSELAKASRASLSQIEELRRAHDEAVELSRTGATFGRRSHAKQGNGRLKGPKGPRSMMAAVQLRPDAKQVKVAPEEAAEGEEDSQPMRLEHAMQFFSVAPGHYAWTSASGQACEVFRASSITDPRPLRRQIAENLAGGLEVLRKTTNASQISRNFTHGVWNELAASMMDCAKDSECSTLKVTSAWLQDPARNDTVPNLESCQLFEATGQELNTTAPPADNSTTTVYFRRNNVSFRVLESAWEHEEALKKEESKEDMVYRSEMEFYRGGCRCSTQDTGGCQISIDDDEVKHWCWVQNATACKAEGLELFRSQERYWTFQICERAGCSCSGHTLPATHHQSGDAAAPVTAGAMHGSVCQRWTKGDEPWCYVGFDSTCPDREAVTRRIAKDGRPSAQGEKVMMFKSSLPCVEDDQQEQLANGLTKMWCNGITSGMEVLMIALNIICLLMVPIFLTFIGNRCNDEFKKEKNFEVDLSSDDDEDDEDDEDDDEDEGENQKDKGKERQNGETSY